MLSAIWSEIMTPSTFTGPLEKAYRRAVIGLAHAMLGAAAAGVFGGWGLAFGLAVAVAYWMAKERGDLRRGGALWDGMEDAVMVCVGTYYGPWWWPLVVLACAGYVMVMGAIRVDR